MCKIVDADICPSDVATIVLYGFAGNVSLDRPWSEDDVAFLRANCRAMTNAELAERLGRTVHSVGHKRGRLGLGPAKRIVQKSARSDWEDDFVRKNHKKMGPSEMAYRLGRSVAALHHRSRHLGLSKPRAETMWSPDEDKILTENPDMPSKDLGKLLPGRSSVGILQRRKKLGLPKYVEKAAWDEAEIRILRDNLKAPVPELRRMVPGKSDSSIRIMARKMGRPRMINRGFTMVGGYRHLFGHGERDVAEHRIVMGWHLGRKLKKGEMVHHINFVRDDNRIENLDLMEDNNRHQAAHKTLSELKGCLLATGAIRYNFTTHLYELGNLTGTARHGR